MIHWHEVKIYDMIGKTAKWQNGKTLEYAENESIWSTWIIYGMTGDMGMGFAESYLSTVSILL